MGFDFSSEERRELGYRLIDRIDQYFSSLNNRAVQPPAAERTVAQSRSRCRSSVPTLPRSSTTSAAR